MIPQDLIGIVQGIVKDAQRLKDTHANQLDAPVNYAALFTHSQEEYERCRMAADKLGSVVEQTSTGPLYKIVPVETSAGPLRLLKIRQPDETRPERGDADFTVSDYPSFKDTYLKSPGFILIRRETFEMVELTDPKFNVRAYFSNPPLDVQMGLK